MSLHALRLRNFKCFEDSGRIELAPLTLLFGRNNSGKSSILQCLLLLRQTLDSPEYGPRLNIRGPLYPAGSYVDMVHQHRAQQHIRFEFGIRLDHGAHHAEIELEFDSDEPRAPRVTRLDVRGDDVEALVLRRGVGRGGPYELLIGGVNLGGERKANFHFPVNQFLPLIGKEPRRVGRPSPAREAAREFARKAMGEFEEILAGLRAVGAFRRQPERRYEFQGRAPDAVDAVGEHVVSALIEDATRRGRRGKLLEAVNRGLKAVGRVRLMPLRRLSKAARIYEVRLRDTDSGRWANFADVGFGIGQAFPVFVEGIRTPPGHLFVVQEPEIHLHPDAQLAMADFLYDLAANGVYVIAETHSEHVLLRVRHRVARAAGDGRRSSALGPRDVSIVHVSRTSDGTGRAQRLPIDELGQIRKWPKDFMEEATQERMALLETVAQRAEA